MTFAGIIDIEQWIEIANSDPELGVIGRWSEFELQFTAADAPVEAFRYSRAVMSRVTTPSEYVDGRDVVVLRGSALAWRDFLSWPPPPDSHHLLAMDRRRTDFEIVHGRHQFVRHLRVINRLLELLRESTQSEASRRACTA